MAVLVLAGASYVRPVSHPTPFCRLNSMRSLGSCCKLFRQAALAGRTHPAGFDVTTKRAFALPRAALSRRTKRAVDTNVDSEDGNGNAADSKVRNHKHPAVAPVQADENTLSVTVGRSLAAVPEKSQRHIWSRHCHAAGQCRTSETVSCSIHVCAHLLTCNQELCRLKWSLSLQRMHPIWSLDT